MRSLRRTFLSIVWVPESPARTALAFSVGVFWAFSPYVGLHSLLGLGCAFLFRLNKVAMLAGVWINLPWFMPLYYAGATWLGVWLTGVSTAGELPDVEISQLIDPAFWGWLLSQWRLLYPAFVGSTVLSVLLGAAAYPVALVAVRRFRRLGKPGWLAPDSPQPPAVARDAESETREDAQTAPDDNTR